MISSVTFEKTIFQKAPLRFEAGTPPIVEVIALGKAIDYIRNIGLATIEGHEQNLLSYATKKLKKIDGLHIIGEANHKASIISFIMDCAHPHDIATIVDSLGVALRAGHHCAEPTMQRFDLSATARISFGLYNTFEEIDCLEQAIMSVKELLE